MIDMKTDDFARRGIDSENESEWRAFRYVMGEMSPAEADAFEEILAIDQEMRELVRGARASWRICSNPVRSVTL